MKFKVGDRVRWLEKYSSYIFYGDLGTITQIENGIYVVKFDNCSLMVYCLPSEIELAHTSTSRPTTLPTDSNERKNYPLHRGCLRYFPAALSGVAKISKLGNDKHNPGEPMYHAREKSTDHGDCIIRHLIDTEDLLAALDRGSEVKPEKILEEVSQLAWRVLAYSQQLHERFGAPLAPGADKFAEDSKPKS